MLADRLRMRRPVAAYTSHTLVAGYNGDSKFPVYGYQEGILGSLTPGTSKGVTVNQVSHGFGTLTFAITGSVAHSYFTKVEIRSSGSLVATITMSTASYNNSGGVTSWGISTANIFTSGASYEVRVYP